MVETYDGDIWWTHMVETYDGHMMDSVHWTYGRYIRHALPTVETMEYIISYYSWCWIYRVSDYSSFNPHSSLIPPS